MAIAADLQVLVADVPALAADAAQPQLEHNRDWDFLELTVGPQTGVSVSDSASGTVVIVLPDLASSLKEWGSAPSSKSSLA